MGILSAYARGDLNGKLFARLRTSLLLSSLIDPSSYTYSIEQYVTKVENGATACSAEGGIPDAD